MNTRRAVIHLEYDCGELWIKKSGEGSQTQSVSQWLAPEYEVPNIDLANYSI